MVNEASEVGLALGTVVGIVNAVGLVVSWTNLICKLGCRLHVIDTKTYHIRHFGADIGQLIVKVIQN